MQNKHIHIKNITAHFQKKKIHRFYSGSSGFICGRPAKNNQKIHVKSVLKICFKAFTN